MNHKCDVLIKGILYFPRYLVLLLMGIQPALAEPPAIYDVEVIIFSHRNSNEYGEQWPVLSRSDRELSGAFPAGEFTELSRSLYRLNSTRSGLSRSSGYSVLFHRAWRQLAYDAEHAVGYPVHTIAESGSNSVAGSIKLSRERYLHLDVHLYLMSPQEGSTGVLYPDAPGSLPAFELREKRRIKSKMLYYFDHPRFGLIASVTPYVPPEVEIQVNEISDVSTNTSAEVAKPAVEQLPADDQLTR